MNEPIFVAWVGVGLTVLVQGMGLAFYYGRLSSKVDGIRREMDTHIFNPMPQAHGCPFFQPDRHSAHQNEQ